MEIKLECGPQCRTTLCDLIGGGPGEVLPVHARDDVPKGPSRSHIKYRPAQDGRPHEWTCSNGHVRHVSPEMLYERWMAAVKSGDRKVFASAR